jgi:hypothetical protein
MEMADDSRPPITSIVMVKTGSNEAVFASNVPAALLASPCNVCCWRRNIDPNFGTLI